MCAGHLKLLLASIIIILLGANTNASATTNIDAPSSINKYMNLSSAAVNTENIITDKFKESRPCLRDHDDRESALCAQWAAVDAANNATQWAIIGIITTVVGNALIFYTIIISRKTLKATVNAERPHVRFYRTIKDLDSKGNIKNVKGINFRNYGRTPALVRSLSLKYALSTKPPFPGEAGPPRLWPEDSVMPQDEEWPRKWYIPPFDETESLNDLVLNHGKNGMRLFVFGEIRYRDAFNEEHVSRFCREWDGQNFTYNTTDIGGNRRLNFSD